MVSRSSAADSNDTACLLPGVDRQQLAAKAEALESAAAAAHMEAQQLNKEGRYEEAKAKYAEMRQLDAAALDITRQLGCQQCMPPPPADVITVGAGDSSSSSGSSTGSVQSGAAGDEEAAAAAAVFESLHQPTPWPAAQEAAGALSMPARAKGAVVGCLVCDAAATGVQWIYDLDTLAQLQQTRQQQQAAAAGPSTSEVGLEFYDPVQSPFLSGYSSGRNSPYGEQTLLLLQSLAQQRGLDCGAYAQLYYDSYSSSSFEGYMNASTVAFLRTYGRGMRPPATGADDAQADCIARCAPLVAQFAGDPRLMQLTAGVTRVTQDTATAVAWACAAAAVLELLLMGRGAAAAVEATARELRQQAEEGAGRIPVDSEVALQVAEQLERVLLLQATPHAAAVEALGRNCHLPNSCQTPLHAVLYHEQAWLQQQQKQPGDADAEQQREATQRVLVAAVRDALAAGGCCASRASFVGACLGAILGVDAIPQEWLQLKYGAAERVRGWADAVCGSRSS